MSTPDHEATGSDRGHADADPVAGPLEEGPLRVALAAIDQARADIEHAKAAFRERREAFSGVLRAELQACDGDEPDRVAERFVPVIGTLYWDEPAVRVADIAAATGLSNDQIRRLAGPRHVDVACHRCGAPTEALQTSRSRSPSALCDACRPIVGLGDPAGGFGMPPWPGSTWSSTAGVVGRDPLDRLVDHLEQVLQDRPCDDTLVRTRQWALGEGVDPDALAQEVRGRGAFCDCEVVHDFLRSGTRFFP